MTQHFSDGISPQDAVRQPRDGGLTTAASSSYVLIVDADAVARAFLAHFLESRGYAVQQAASAAEALGLMVSIPAAMVLSELVMPGHDGAWLAERLRAHWPQTPIVLMVDAEDAQAVRGNRELEAVDC